MASSAVDLREAPPASHVARELLARPAKHDHIVQFYEDDSFLAGVVADFVGAGLASGEPALIVAIPSHREAFRKALATRGVDVDAAELAGRLTMLDARETLATFMTGGLPGWSRFREVTGAAIERALAGTCHGKIRAYGEMVDLLWKDGQREAAIRLEELWNDLAGEHAFSLLCAYSMANFRDETHGPAFLEICGTHSHVIPTEHYARIADSDDRLRTVTLLQQRAQMLEREIEQRKQAEQLLAAALAQREEFLAIAGHELKTPITAVQIVLQSLTAIAKGGDQRFTARLQKATRGLDRLARLANELTDVTSFDAGHLRLELDEVDLAAIVRESLDAVSDQLAQADCRIELSSDALVPGRWDRSRLEQVVANLLSNALKYGRGAPIQLRVERTPTGARLFVRDHGGGVDAHDRTRIFERFERAVSSSHFGGLGLGLYVVKRIVEAHGGTVRVETPEGRGAAFVVDLPAEVGA